MRAVIFQDFQEEDGYGNVEDFDMFAFVKTFYTPVFLHRKFFSIDDYCKISSEV